ncbi:MAG: DUF1987 domain-containing protein [Magnetococcales bacterium]|nr:DUF1987 domain-containing protein [Magnetococcales bacterium]MBF0583280.1 DUF1987 domain-containing protein [Magnetococcales bacterium]
MDTIKIEASERSPGVDFDFAGNIFSLHGESYPEDVSAFYGPLVKALREYLEQQNGAEITFNFELVYFNSSSAKVLIGLFDLLDSAASDNQVVVNWYFEEDDDNMKELGEEFGEELEKATFNMVARG